MSLRHYLVSGRVQGVGFRRFVENKAKQYGVGGLVRNLVDGRVEFIAHGEPSAIDSLEQAVRRGPMLSHVRAVELTALQPESLPAALEKQELVGAQPLTMRIAEDGDEPWISKP